MALFGYGTPRPKFGVGFDPAQHIGVPTQAPMQQPMQAPQQAPQPEPGFWQGGGKLRTRDGLAGALAVLSDVFNQQAGNQGGAVQNLTGGRLSAIDMARQQEQAAMARQQGLQDYEAKQQIDQRYRAPPAEGEFIRTMRAAGIDPASPEGLGLLRQRAATMALPAPQMIGSPETGYRFVTPPAPTMPTAQAGPQPGAVVGGYRFKGGNPNDRGNWEQATGGGAGNGTGTFQGAFNNLRP